MLNAPSAPPATASPSVESASVRGPPPIIAGGRIDPAIVVRRGDGTRSALPATAAVAEVEGEGEDAEGAESAAAAAAEAEAAAALSERIHGRRASLLPERSLCAFDNDVTAKLLSARSTDDRVDQTAATATSPSPAAPTAVAAVVSLSLLPPFSSASCPPCPSPPPSPPPLLPPSPPPPAAAITAEGGAAAVAAASTDTAADPRGTSPSVAPPSDGDVGSWRCGNRSHGRRKPVSSTAEDDARRSLCPANSGGGDKGDEECTEELPGVEPNAGDTPTVLPDKRVALVPKSI